jgi:NAD(P)-dependent dehydrogenase (short-subunit alcohol dehydrogenase family)
VRTLAREGVAVVVNGRTAGFGEGSVESVVAEIVAAGGTAAGVVADITDPHGVDRLVATAVERFGRIDILVNNAGVFDLHRPIWDVPLPQWARTIDVNLTGTFLVTRAVTPIMIEQGGGAIVNLTSGQAHEDASSPRITDISYACSKAAVERFTEFLARDLAGTGIAVNALRPMRVQSEGNRRVLGVLGADVLADFVDPSELEPAFLFLTRQRGQFTGRIVRRTDILPDTELR